VGINVFVHYLINATGGKSPLQLIQKLGRGLRKSPDKTLLNYHDFHFIGNSFLEKHSIQRMKTLEIEGQMSESPEI